MQFQQHILRDSQRQADKRKHEFFRLRETESKLFRQVRIGLLARMGVKEVDIMDTQDFMTVRHFKKFKDLQDTHE